MKTVKFTKYQSIYDQDVILYGLDFGCIEKMIDGVRFIEVTSDFDRVQMVRADSLKSIGYINKEL